MDTNYYSIGKTLWKFLKSAGILGSGSVAAIAFPDEGASTEQWALFIAALLPPLITALSNYLKHSHKPRKGSVDHVLKNIYRGCIAFLLCTALAFLSSGCTTLGQSSVTTRFEESVSPDGTATTIFEAKSRGEVDASLHKMDYRYGGDENHIVVGQDVAGITSPAQQAYLAAWGQLIANVPGMWHSLLGAITPAPGATPETPVEE